NQASASYYNVEASAKTLEKQIRIIENNVALLINEISHTIERSEFRECKNPESGLSKKISLAALANRPDVKVAEYELSRNFYGVNIARSALYPSIKLGGSIGWTNNLGVISNPGSLLMTALGSLTQPIFNRGINMANLKIAKAQYEQAMISFQKTLLNAGNEVNNALIECQNSTDKQLFRKNQVIANQQALENSMELMKYTSSTYLEVLIAQNALLQSKLLQVADWFEGIQGRINLYKALGGGTE
ncbi:MAG: TolC family protein, partial [Bacteroidales bacterium]